MKSQQCQGQINCTHFQRIDVGPALHGCPHTAHSAGTPMEPPTGKKITEDEA